jgi:hypothetical protein
VARLDLAEARRVEGGGVVDEEIQAREALLRRADQRLRGDGREQVRLDAQRAAGAHGVQLLLERRRLLLGAPVVQHDVRAGRVQAARDRRAHAPCRAGHQRDLARQRRLGHAGILG